MSRTQHPIAKLKRPTNKTSRSRHMVFNMVRKPNTIYQALNGRKSIKWINQWRQKFINIKPCREIYIYNVFTISSLEKQKMYAWHLPKCTSHKFFFHTHSHILPLCQVLVKSTNLRDALTRYSNFFLLTNGKCFSGKNWQIEIVSYFTHIYKWNTRPEDARNICHWTLNNQQSINQSD